MTKREAKRIVCRILYTTLKELKEGGIGEDEVITRADGKRTQDQLDEDYRRLVDAFEELEQEMFRRGHSK